MQLRTKRSNRYGRETYIAGKVYDFDDETAEKMLKLWQQVGAEIVYLFEVADDDVVAEIAGSEADANASKFSGREGSEIGRTPAPKEEDGDEATDTEADDEATDTEDEETEAESPE